MKKLPDKATPIQAKLLAYIDEAFVNGMGRSRDEIRAWAKRPSQQILALYGKGWIEGDTNTCSESLWFFVTDKGRLAMANADKGGVK